jgi:protein phosphatase methylesterase 1
MGGAVCVRACPILQEKRYKVAGVAVLDVVEGELVSLWGSEVFIPRLGSALEALPIMMGLLDSRPDGFDSLEEAIQWQ